MTGQQGLVAAAGTLARAVAASLALAARAADGTDAPGLWDRPTLTGDWFGQGAAMREVGLGWRASLTHFYQGLASGEGPRDSGLGGKLDAFLDADGPRLGAWNGSSLHAHGELNYGEALEAPGGVFLPTNVGMRFPGHDTPRGDLALFVAQQLPGGVRVMAGRINTVDLYSAGREFSGGRGVERFQHLEFAAPASGITPPMALGGMVSVATRPAKLTFFAYDPDSKTGRLGLGRAFEKGVTLNASAEMKGALLGQDGRHIVSAAYSTQDGADFNDIPELLLPRSIAPASRDNRWHVSYATEQALWRDKANPRRALGVFAHGAVSDANPNPIGWSAFMGVGGTGILGGREHDRLGAGVFWLGFSRSLKDALGEVGIPVRDEAGAEVFYNMAVTPWLFVTADMIAVRPPRPGSDWAVIGGLRAQAVF